MRRGVLTISLVHGDFLTELRNTPATAPALRAKRKRISREVAALDRAALLRLARGLVTAGIERFVAYELVLNHRSSMESITREEIEHLGNGMQHWGDVDAFACILAGPAWRAGRLTDAVLRAWARSDDWCWRRAALVSTVPLNSHARGGAGDSKRTLALCEVLISDRHALVVKAMSWALRVLAKRDPQRVRDFFSKHREELAPLVNREVARKLDTGLKNPRPRNLRA